MFEPGEEFSCLRRDDRPPAMPTAGLPLYEFHTEPVLHGLDMAPSLAKGYSHFRRRPVDRPISVDCLEQKPSALSEYRFAVRLDPHFRSDLQSVMKILHNAWQGNIFRAVVSARCAGPAQDFSVPAEFPHVLHLLAASLTADPSKRPARHVFRPEVHADFLNLKQLPVGHDLVGFDLSGVFVIDAGSVLSGLLP